MSKTFNGQSYVENGQFSGGANILGTHPLADLSFIAGGLYVGLVGDLTARTVDGSIVTFVSASGFIPGLFTAVSASSTCGAIVALK
jgi:hypothetical protein